MYPAGRALRHGRAVHPRAFTAPSRGVGWGARAAGAATTQRRALSSATVPGAFPGHPYDPRKKAEGTAEYEQLRTNWGECVPYRHGRLASPADLSELQQVVSETEKLRMVGSAHSFSHLSDAPDATMLSLAFMARIGDIDPEAMTVSAEGGVTLGELCRYLAPRDCALKNVASFPHLTWVGAAATGSHGSGIRNQVIPLRPYLAHFPPVFSRFFPFFARSHRLDEAVPTSPKPEPRAKKQPARGPRGENSPHSLGTPDANQRTNWKANAAMIASLFGLANLFGVPTPAHEKRKRSCSLTPRRRAARGLGGIGSDKLYR